MNTYNRNPLDELKSFFTRGSVLSVLILINIAVWLLVKIVTVLFFLFNITEPTFAENWFLQIFALPAYIPSLFSHPWSILSYMFLHFDFFHILFNMLWLYWFGMIFVQYLTSRQLLFTYLLGGIAGGLLYIITFNVFPVFQNSLPISLALGASASVMAIVSAISFYVPNYTIQLLFFGRIKILYLAIILFIVDFFSISTGNSGGHIAHIGGALWGFLYISLLKSGSLRQMNGMEDLFFTPIKKIFSSLRQQKPNYTNFDKRPKSDEDYNLEKKEKQKKIDTILEKISKGGYESLTKTEKEFLFKTSGNK
jgi:membrane associated rhomboid family serine protease